LLLYGKGAGHLNIYPMRNIFLLLILMVLARPAHAQELKIAGQGSLSLAGGGALHFDGLTLTPSSQINIPAKSLSKDTAVSNSFGNPYVARTYRFSASQVFSGTIRIDYLESELNGLNDSLLQVSNYNDTAWQFVGTSSSSSTGNYVEATGIAATPLRELILASSIPLPLEWGEIWATRQQASVIIKWHTTAERNVSHFDVERSNDAVNWITAIAGVKAGNKPYGADYEQTDIPGYDGRLYYRIKQTDKDGHFSFSRTVAVAADNTAHPVVVSPNPARSYFMLSGVAASGIDKISLLHPNGMVIRTWKGNQSRYALSGLSGGIYYLQIRMVSGHVYNQPLLIR
jgi:hypothetical protein